MKRSNRKTAYGRIISAAALALLAMGEPVYAEGDAGPEIHLPRRPRLAATARQEAAPLRDEFILDSEIRGASRVIGGIPLDSGTMVVGTAAELYMSGEQLLFPNDHYNYYSQRGIVKIGFLPYLDARFDIKYIRASNDLVEPNVIKAFGDSNMGVRASWKLGALYRGGVAGSAKFFSGVQSRTGVVDGASFDIRHIGAVAKGKYSFHYNIGYDIDRSGNIVGDNLVPTLAESAAYELSAYQRLLAGARVQAEFDHRYLPYIEYTADMPIDAPVPLEQGPQRLNVGAAIGLAGGLVVNLAAGIATVQPQERGVQIIPPWVAHMGLTYGFDAKKAFDDLKQWIDPDPMMFALTVSDAFTREAIPEARVRLFAPDRTVENLGGAQWSGFADQITFAVSAQYYVPATGTSPMLETGKLTSLGLALKPTVGWLMANIISPNADDKAQLILTAAGKAVSTAVEGAFRLPMDAGNYEGYITAANVMPVDVSFTVDIGKYSLLGDILLRRPIGPEPTLPAPDMPAIADQGQPTTWYFFEPDKSEPKDKVVLSEAVPPGEGDEDSDDPSRRVSAFAVGSYELSEKDKAKVKQLAKLILEDATIRYIIVDAGADDTGTQRFNAQLSQARAYAVFDELRDNGITDDRVALKIGYFIRPFERASRDDRLLERRVAVRIIR